MSPGIRATVKFAAADICPIVELSAAAATTIESVRTSVSPGDCTACVTEFSVDANHVPAVETEPSFTDGSTHQYRVTHDGGVDCPCECLGSYGCPAARYVAENGTLIVAFHATDYAQLREIITDLRDRFPSAEVTRFVRSPESEQASDCVSVDRSKLTQRQREVMRTAREMGYFERPRRANASEVAAELEINLSTFREHVMAAETKIFADMF